MGSGENAVIGFDADGYWIDLQPQTDGGRRIHRRTRAEIDEVARSIVAATGGRIIDTVGFEAPPPADNAAADG